MNNFFYLSISGMHPRYLADDGELGERLEIAQDSRIGFQVWDSKLESQVSPDEILLLVRWENGQISSYHLSPPSYEWHPIIPADTRVGRASGDIIIAGIGLPFYPFQVVVVEE